jgi:hypothetical protein
VEPPVIGPQRRPWGEAGRGEQMGIDISDAASEQFMRLDEA